MKNPFHKKEISPRETFIRSFLDCIAPGVVKFEVDHYIFGNCLKEPEALYDFITGTLKPIPVSPSENTSQ